MDLKAALDPIIEGEILDDDKSLTDASKDASIFEIRPKLIIAPQNTDDIKHLINFINDHPEEKLSITPRSAGTCMSGGAIGESIILDMTHHFHRILGFGESSVRVLPGMYYRDFEKETLKVDRLLPCYTASREINTVGGMVGNNSAGEKTLSFGQTKDYVQRLKVVLADGNEYEFYPLTKDELNTKLAQDDFEGQIYQQIYQLISENHDLIYDSKPKVSKNSAGYLVWEVWDGKRFDLSKLIVGSQGTLGVVTEIEFKLIKPKKVSNLLVIFLSNLDNLAEIVNKVLQFKPESFESYDDQTMKVAMKFLPEVLKMFKETNLLYLMWQFLPEMWMSLTGGFPKLILLAEFTGESEDEVTKKLHQANDSLKEFGLRTHLVSNETEEKKYWTLRRESFNLLRHHSEHMRTAPFIDDIIVNPENLPEFLPKLKAIMDQYKDSLIYTIAGHIGNGNFHIIPLMDFTKPETRKLIPEIGQKVYELVFEYKGSMAAEHNDGLVRGPYLEEMFGEDMFQIFKEIKYIFDPKNIFNPHKKVDATWEYSLDHLSKEQIHPHTS